MNELAKLAESLMPMRDGSALRWLHNLIMHEKSWDVDEVKSQNDDVYLYYEVGTLSDTKYIEIDPDKGLITLGLVKGAYPYITDGIFLPLISLPMGTNAQALQSLVLNHIRMCTCPFCGGRPDVTKTRDNHFVASCGRCNFTGPSHDTYVNLLRHWNWRYA